LSYYLAPARAQTDAPVAGQGARIARLTTRGTLIAGSVFSLAVSILALRSRATPAIAAALLVTLLSGLYYQRRLGGITGDCFGATNQLAEIAVYLTGAWIL
jgi:adenosylcobinamide-GDP ribazoletransferase